MNSPGWEHPLTANPLFRKHVGNFFDSNWPDSRTDLAEHLKSEIGLKVPFDPNGLPSLELFFKDVPLKFLLKSITLIEIYLEKLDDDRNATLKEFELQKKDQAGEWNMEIKNILMSLDQTDLNSSLFGVRVGNFFDSNWPNLRTGLADFFKSEKGMDFPTHPDGQPSLELFLRNASKDQIVLSIILIECYFKKTDGGFNRTLKGFGLKANDHVGRWNRGVKRVFWDMDPSFADGPIFRKNVGNFFDSNWPESRNDLAEFLKSEIGLEVPPSPSGQHSMELIFKEIPLHYLITAIAIINVYLKRIDNEKNEISNDPYFEKSDQAGKWYFEVKQNLLGEKQRYIAEDECGIHYTYKPNFNNIEICSG